MLCFLASLNRTNAHTYDFKRLTAPQSPSDPPLQPRAPRAATSAKRQAEQEAQDNPTDSERSAGHRLIIVSLYPHARRGMLCPRSISKGHRAACSAIRVASLQRTHCSRPTVAFAAALAPESSMRTSPPASERAGLARRLRNATQRMRATVAVPSPAARPTATPTAKKSCCDELAQPQGASCGTAGVAMSSKPTISTIHGNPPVGFD